jgi:site-specific recombinase XerC
MAGASAQAGRNSDERLVRLYLDMLAAERGAGANTLAAYRRDLDDLSPISAGCAALSLRHGRPICGPIWKSFHDAA